MNRTVLFHATAILLLACLLVFSLTAAQNRRARETVRVSANDITAQSTFTASDKSDTSPLTDGDASTPWQANGASLTVSYEEDIRYLYIEYAVVPSHSYEIDGGLTGGDTPFISEVITLPEPRSSVTLFPGDISLTLVRVIGDGDLPDDVPVWEETPEKAALMLIVAHPDDDILWFGGTLPYYSGVRKLNTVVVYLSTPNRRRMSEALNGLWTAGVRQYPVFGSFPDVYSRLQSEMLRLWGEEAVDGFLTETIRRHKPDVLLSHGPDGEYGHAAHKIICARLQVCLHDIEDTSFMPQSAKKYGVWTPKKVYFHAYTENTVEMNWDVPLDRFGGKTGYEVASEAFACHGSQQTGRHLLRHKGKTGCTSFGLYCTKVGKDVYGNDFFENIPFSSEQLSEPITSPVPSVPFGVAGNPVTLLLPQEGALPAESEAQFFDEENPSLFLPLCLIAAALAFGVLVVILRRIRKKRGAP